MDDKAGTAAKIAAIVLLASSGACLMAASPILLFLGAWGGSDSGSIAGGIVGVLGMPWATYIVCVAGASVLVHRRWNIAAFGVALVPSSIEIWVAVSLRH